MAGRVRKKETKEKTSGEKDVKVAWVASGGGHIQELSQLKQVWSRYDSIVVTEKCDFDESTARKTYYVNQVNRKNIHSWLSFFTFFPKAYKILKREQINCIISTGAMCAVPFMIVGKLLGCRIIYIESFARVEGMSLTGKTVYPWADLFVVQWPELQQKYPRTVLGGSIF